MTGKAKTAARAVVKADRSATDAAAAHRDSRVVKALGAISEVADQPPLIVLSLATIGVGAALRRPAVARAGVRMLAAHLLATGIKTAIKRSIDRTRPARAIETGEHRFRRGSSRNHDQNAFPSGHTAGAVAVAEAIARDHPAATAPVRLAAAGIAAIQLPRGTHYLGDVMAGAAIGWTAEWLASAAIDRIEAATLGATSAPPEA